MRADRRGSALVDVLIAIVLLATAGTGLISLLGLTSHTMRSVLESERLARRASEELDRFVLRDRSALGTRVGQTRDHGWTLDVVPLGHNLFDVRIAESDTRALLVRTLYRPAVDSSHATPSRSVSVCSCLLREREV